MVTRKSIGITSRRNGDGSMSYTAQLLVKPFPRTSQTFPSMAEAATWRKQMRDELQKQRKDRSVRPDLPTLSMASLNGEYLKDPKAVALADFKDRKRHLDWWTLKFGTVKVLDFGVMEGRAARDLLIPNRAAGTVDRYIAAERAAWNWGRAAGLVPKDRAWPPQLMLPEPDARTRYLSDDELTTVLTEAKKHSPVMLAAVTVALATGVRQGEMLRLTWADVDFARSTIRLCARSSSGRVLTKSRAARSVHLPAIAIEALKAVKADTVVSTTHVFLYRDGTPMTGDRLHHEWCDVRTAAGLIDFRWHDFRHSCASFLAQHGSTLLEIGSVLGHKRAQTTLKYAHLVAGKAVTGHGALDAKLRDSSKA
jgi:integrase